MSSEEQKTDPGTNASSGTKPRILKQSKEGDGPSFLPGLLVIIFGVGVIVWVFNNYDHWIAEIQHSLWIKTQLLTGHFKNWIWRSF